MKRGVENLERAKGDLFSMTGTSVGKISDQRKECRNCQEERVQGKDRVLFKLLGEDQTI